MQNKQQVTAGDLERVCIVWEKTDPSQNARTEMGGVFCEEEEELM